MGDGLAAGFSDIGAKFREKRFELGFGRRHGRRLGFGLGEVKLLLEAHKLNHIGDFDLTKLRICSYNVPIKRIVGG
jgi:hypothetical protein